MTLHPLMRIKRFPHTCIWELTRACNLRCVHCENFGGEKGKQELTFDEMLRVAESLKTLGCKVVDITGGEPLLHPRWDALAERLTDAGIRCAIITNGLRFDEAALERAVAAGIEIAAFSLDGPKPIHDRIRRRPNRWLPGKSPFDVTVSNIKRAAGRMRTTVITQVNRLNLYHLLPLHDLLREIGVDKWQIQLTVPIGRVLQSKTPLILSPDDLNVLTAFIQKAVSEGKTPFIDTSDTIGYYTDRERYLRKRAAGQGLWLGCQAGIRSMAITFDGKVRGCSILPPEFDVGDLHEESLETIWNDADRFGFSTAFDPQKLTGDCKSCAYGAICRAGCTAMAFYTTGTIYNNPYCISRPSVRNARTDALFREESKVAL